MKIRQASTQVYEKSQPTTMSTQDFPLTPCQGVTRRPPLRGENDRASCGLAQFGKLPPTRQSMTVGDLTTTHGVHVFAPCRPDVWRCGHLRRLCVGLTSTSATIPTFAQLKDTSSSDPDLVAMPIPLFYIEDSLVANTELPIPYASVL
ncbi:hypothetical protein B296_00049748 [Ensete ventricosum]|uniref:Uncharacterized protein n=1 Tax=Ensete ventricosum TaxID=4639 RepID=A0A426XRA7_ENSVE|nr:hypothetical protein B296_00049748 [Ensete ventricosum]